MCRLGFVGFLWMLVFSILVMCLVGVCVCVSSLVSVRCVCGECGWLVMKFFRCLIVVLLWLVCRLRVVRLSIVGR